MVLKFFKIVVINHGLNFKPKIIVGDYGFTFLEKKYKTVISNYGFSEVEKRELLFL